MMMATKLNHLKVKYRQLLTKPYNLIKKIKTLHYRDNKQKARLKRYVLRLCLKLGTGQRCHKVDYSKGNSLNFSDKGLMLKTSPSKLFMVANLCYQLS